MVAKVVRRLVYPIKHLALPRAVLRTGEGGRVAGVVAAQPALEQPEKQQAVHPGEAQLQGHAEELGGGGGAVSEALGGGQVGQQIFASE